MGAEIILRKDRYNISASLVDLGFENLTDFLQSDDLVRLIDAGFGIFQVVSTDGPKAMWPLVQSTMNGNGFEYRFDDTRATDYPDNVKPFVDGELIVRK